MPFIDSQAQDAALDDVADNGERFVLTSTEATTHAEVGTNELAAVALTPGDGNGDFEKQAGTPDGRELNLTAQTVTGSAGGTANSWAIVDDTNSRLKSAGQLSAAIEIVNGQDQDVNAGVVARVRDPA